jgi:ABC-2 type transport system permease protein
VSGARWIVARREVTERLRSRAFRIGTAIQVAAVVVLLAVAALTSGGEDTKKVGLVGPASEAYAAPLQAAGPALDASVETEPLDDRAAAVRAVRDGDVDAAVIDGRTVLVKDDPEDTLAAVVQETRRQLALRDALQQAGADRAQVQSALDPPPLAVEALEPQNADLGERQGVAFIAILLLYFAIFTYGLSVASGVVEEKASRVVEVVLSAISPRDLLAGKILGLGAVGLVQFALTVAVGVIGAQVVESIDLPGITAGWGLLLAAWFVLGYLLYACLYAVAGALVSRQEDLGSSTSALNMIVVAAYIGSFISLQNPEGTLMTVLSFIPVSAPMAMPARWLVTDVPAWELIASFALTLVTTLAMLRLATAVYSNAALRMGPKLSLRAALASRR